MSIYTKGPFSLDLATLTDIDFTVLASLVDNERKRRFYPAELTIGEKCLVRCGQHITAIKDYRNRTGVGLREAKDACDAFRATVPGWFSGARYDEYTGMWVKNPPTWREP